MHPSYTYPDLVANGTNINKLAALAFSQLQICKTSFYHTFFFFFFFSVIGLDKYKQAAVVSSTCNRINTDAAWPSGTGVKQRLFFVNLTNHKQICNLITVHPAKSCIWKRNIVLIRMAVSRVYVSANARRSYLIQSSNNIKLSSPVSLLNNPQLLNLYFNITRSRIHIKWNSLTDTSHLTTPEFFHQDLSILHWDINANVKSTSCIHPFIWICTKS